MRFDVVVQLCDIRRRLEHVNNISVFRFRVEDEFAIVEGRVQV
jgi:hypothetical protein